MRRPSAVLRTSRAALLAVMVLVLAGWVPAAGANPVGGSYSASSVLSYDYDALAELATGRTVESAGLVAPVDQLRSAVAPVAGTSGFIYDSSFGLVAPRTTPELARPSTVANAGAPIRSFVTQTDTVYYRVYSGDSTVGGFLTSAPPRSSAEAIRSLALPPGNQAAYVQEVLVPAGTRLQSSLPTEAFGQPGGALQFELLDRIPIANFGPGSPLG